MYLIRRHIYRLYIELILPFFSRTGLCHAPRYCCRIVWDLRTLGSLQPAVSQCKAAYCIGRWHLVELDLTIRFQLILFFFRSVPSATFSTIPFPAASHRPTMPVHAFISTLVSARWIYPIRWRFSRPLSTVHASKSSPVVALCPIIMAWARYVVIGIVMLSPRRVHRSIPQPSNIWIHATSLRWVISCHNRINHSHRRRNNSLNLNLSPQRKPNSRYIFIADIHRNIT